MSNKPNPHSNISQAFLLSATLPLWRRELRRVIAHRVRAQKKLCAATLTFGEWLALLQHYEWSCAFCRGPFESLEHIVPLRAGGGTTATNCVPCCLSCNRERERMQQVEKRVLQEVESLA